MLLASFLPQQTPCLSSVSISKVLIFLMSSQIDSSVIFPPSCKDTCLEVALIIEHWIFLEWCQSFIWVFATDGVESEPRRRDEEGVAGEDDVD